jgi:hypothetical protein
MEIISRPASIHTVGEIHTDTKRLRRRLQTETELYKDFNFKILTDLHESLILREFNL